MTARTGFRVLFAELGFNIRPEAPPRFRIRRNPFPASGEDSIFEREKGLGFSGSGELNRFTGADFYISKIYAYGVVKITL